MDDNNGQYIYAIVDAHHPLGEGLVGLGGAPVRKIVDEDLGAIVSALHRPKVRPERRNLGAHMQVLKRLMADATILPLAFGNVATDDASVRVLLQRNQVTLREQLNAVRGKLEMGLRVVWDVANVFDYFVSTRPDLRAARDNLGDVRKASRDQMIALGRFFEEVVNDERDRIYDEVAGILESFGAEVHRNAPRGEREALNLACLVERDRQSDFDRAIGEAASHYDASYTFDISGPWAPSSFVDMTLEV